MFIINKLMKKFYEEICEMVSQNKEFIIYYHHQLYQLPKKEQDRRMKLWLEEYEQAEK